MRAPTSAIVGLTVALLVTGCAGTSPSDSGRPDSSTRGQRSPLRAVEISSTHLHALDVGPGVLVGRNAVLTTSGPRTQQLDRVVVIPASGGPVSQVARTRFRHGVVNFAAAAGHWVAWTDQSQMQSDTRGNVLWRIWAKDLDTGTTKLLASNADRADPYVPHVHSGSGHIFWGTAEADRSVRQWVWSPGERQPKALLRHADLSPDIESADRDNLIYLGPSALPHHGHTVGGDCWSVKFKGSDPVPLTHTGLAMDCQAADGALVWFTHIPSSYRPLPPDGALDDPWEVWTKQLDASGPAVRLSRGYIQGRSPAIGTGFAVWSGDGVRPFELHTLDASSTTITLSGRALGPRVFATEGSLLMLADQGPSGRARPTIRFVRVS